MAGDASGSGSASNPGAGHARAAWRVRWPRSVQACAFAAVLLLATYLAAYLILRSASPDIASGMLRMYGLSFAAGRETAMFDALHRGMPPLWVLGLSIFDDIGSLLVSIVSFWFLVAALRRKPLARRLLAHIEKQALRHRHWIRRWGLGGLAAFYFLPGLGSGVLAASAMGILAHIPIDRLVLVLGAAVFAVDAFWVLVLQRPAQAVPSGGWLDWLPLLVVALVVGAALLAAWRDRKQRHIAYLDWDPRLDGQRKQELARVGIVARDGLVEADLPKVQAAVGVDANRALFAAELLLLAGSTPAMVGGLVRAGVTGLRDVAHAAPQALARMAGLPAAELRLAQSWRGQAAAMVATAGSAWRQD